MLAIGNGDDVSYDVLLPYMYLILTQHSSATSFLFRMCFYISRLNLFVYHALQSVAALPLSRLFINHDDSRSASSLYADSNVSIPASSAGIAVV
jgi:hypothetical protein